MNIAFFLTPKLNVAWLYADTTVGEALEKMRSHGYTAIPLINREDRYVGTLSEGDLLWHMVENPGDFREAPVGSILRGRPNHPVSITAAIEQLIHTAENQNFVPVVDDRGVFIGIVTRKDIIRHYTSGNREEKGKKLL